MEKRAGRAAGKMEIIESVHSVSKLPFGTMAVEKWSVMGNKMAPAVPVSGNENPLLS